MDHVEKCSIVQKLKTTILYNKGGYWASLSTLELCSNVLKYDKLIANGPAKICIKSSVVCEVKEVHLEY